MNTFHTFISPFLISFPTSLCFLLFIFLLWLWSISEGYFRGALNHLYFTRSFRFPKLEFLFRCQ